MKKVSIIIPVYNGEEYIEKCLLSIFNQTCDNYEIIVVDDNSSDNSINILEKYIDRIKLFRLSKHDPCAVRNYGLSKCNGDRLLFLDMDDTLDSNLLEEINRYDEFDMLRFQSVMVNDKGEVVEEFITDTYGVMDGTSLLNNFIINNEIYSPSWLYCYDSKFWKANGFKFCEGKTQEDFGLTSYQLFKAKIVISIPFIGYYYYQSNNSIMRNDDYSKKVKKANDVLFHCDSHYKSIISNIDNPTIRKNFIKYLLDLLEHKKNYLSNEDKDAFENELILRKKRWK